MIIISYLKLSEFNLFIKYLFHSPLCIHSYYNNTILTSLMNRYEENKPMRDNANLLNTRFRSLLQRTVQNNAKEIDNAIPVKH